MMNILIAFYKKHLTKALLIAFALSFNAIAFSQFRIIGYVPSMQNAADIDKINFKTITHLNIAFINPDAAGSLILPAGFDTLIKCAHQYHIQVLASLGGGSFNPYYARLLSDGNRSLLVKNLVQLTVDHKLDGLDIDLENDAIDSNYDKLVADLSQKLKPLGKLLTAAVATWNGEKISNADIEKFDYINVMSYDQTGPWRPDKPGPHSTFIKAGEDLDYWIVQRGIAKNKVSLGVPFYGYCFGTQYGESLSYSDIIRLFPGTGRIDSITPETGGSIYYNGATTIKNKAALAYTKAGGIMIWELLQDAEGEHSLLKAIVDTVRVQQGNLGK